MNGYKMGFPFYRERVEIYHKIAFDYLNGLDYTIRQKRALMSLLDKAMELNRLDFGVSYDDLKDLFSTSSPTTVRVWLNEFEHDNIFICTKKGSYKPRPLASQYRLMLPDYCYKALDDKIPIIESL